MTVEETKEMVRFVGKFILVGVLILGAVTWIVMNSFTYVDGGTVGLPKPQNPHERLCPDEGTYVIGGLDDFVIHCKDRYATVYKREELQNEQISY